MTVTDSGYERKLNELYETEAWATHAGCRALKQLGLWHSPIINEPSAGNHAMVKPLLEEGAEAVYTSDIETYDHCHVIIFDFINGSDDIVIAGNVFTNPPYGKSNRLAVKYAEAALRRCPEGFICLLLTAKFDSGKTRTHLFRDNPRFVAKVPLLDRISWEGNGQTGTEDHAFYIWAPASQRPRDPILIYEGKAKHEKV